MPTDWVTRRPTYLPARFKSRRLLQGASEPGFGRHPDQQIVIHTAGWEETDWTSPLTVYLAPTADVALAGTEGRPGTPVDVGHSSVTAVYHDGAWTAAPGGGGRRVWNTSLAHSITAHGQHGSVAVRGNKHQVPREELVKIVRSFEFDA